MTSFTESANNKAQTVVYLTTKDKILAGISIADLIRPESKQAIQSLQEMGIEVAMLTSDSQVVAKAVANRKVQHLKFVAPFGILAYPALDSFEVVH